MSWEDLKQPAPRLTPEEKKRIEDEQRRVDLLFGRVFGTPDGMEVIALLRSNTIERSTAPDISERALCHLEGQRHLVRAIETRTANGLAQHPSELRRRYPALGSSGASGGTNPGPGGSRPRRSRRAEPA